ncbi:MAG: hypothetical protein MUP70_04865, partial [Candidatus Aminicenantes bacterium]|nr:hypothetical protein [Candidatus Aminicenantes bacterium]
ILTDEEGTLWIGTYQGGLNRFDRQTDGFERYGNDAGDGTSLHFQNITSLCDDKNGRIWIGTAADGIQIFDKRTTTFEHIRHDPQEDEGLTDNIITSLYIDRSGVIWVGTGRGGILKTLVNLANFSHYKHIPEDGNSLRSNSVCVLHEDVSGRLWIGTDKGLNVLSSASERAGRLEPAPPIVQIPDEDTVLAITEDSDQRLFFGTEKGELYSLNMQNTRFERKLNPANGNRPFSDFPITALRPDGKRNHILWMGTDGDGLFRINLFTGETSAFRRAPSNEQSLRDNKILSLCEDRNGFIWVGTAGAGVSRFNKKDRWTHFQFKPDSPDADAPNHNTITAILEDDSGMLWIGTGRGLNVYDPVRQKWSVYTRRDGLPGDYICGIARDDMGYLWLSTESGICRMDPDIEEFITFSADDGLQGERFAPGVFAGGKHNRIYFGGYNGFNSIRAGELKKSLYIPNIVLTAYEHSGTTEEIDGTPSHDKPLIFSSTDRVIAFHFAVLCYANPDQNSFAYWLQNRQSEWIDLGRKRSVSFKSLQPGDYILNIKGANHDGVWNAKGLSVRFRVKRSVWRIAIFLLLVGFAAVALVLLWYFLQRKSNFSIKKANIY